MTSDQTENEKGGFASKLLPFIKKQTRSFKENYFCKRIRLGVTGLSKSGKTTFITSLIYQLQRDPTLQVSIVPDFPRDAKAFPYGDNITRLLSKNPQWPESTKEESEICLKIMFGKKEIFLEIVDYPGEWLLDLPMLEKSYAQWSENLQEYLKNIQETGLDWVDKAAFLSRNEQEMGETELNDKILEIADDYRKWLLKLKDKGFAYLRVVSSCRIIRRIFIHMSIFSRGFGKRICPYKLLYLKNCNNVMKLIRQKRSFLFIRILRT